MDADRFDALIRTFTAVPRRVALRGLFGGALTTIAGWSLREDTAAKKKRRKKKKKQQQCTPERVCGAGCCPVGQVCAGGVCRGSGTCQPTDNLCSVVATCNGNGGCGCLTHFTDGAKLCGTSTPDGCNINCQADTDCVAFGAGAFCVRKVGDICCFGLIPLNQGFCALPCPT
jgi:hypothetical protein